MKQHYYLAFLLFFASCQDHQHENSIQYANEKISIDGKPNDHAWKHTHWRAMDQRWLGNEYSKEDFQGRYKVTWDHDHLYVLAEIHDDKLIDIHKDGLDNYWNDDCLEVFIDQDASKGDHQYNYNAFAYHIALDNKVVDIGVDSLPHYYDHVQCIRQTKGNKSIWELSIDIYDDSYQMEKNNKKTRLEEFKKIGFAIAYCDNDQSEERENFIGSVLVEGEDKNRGWIDAGVFGQYILVK